jgi:hypothetical protein
MALRPARHPRLASLNTDAGGRLNGTNPTRLAASPHASSTPADIGQRTP